MCIISDMVSVYDGDDDGAAVLVLKNFPTKEFIFTKLSGIATEINFINLTYYWIISFRLTKSMYGK